MLLKISDGAHGWVLFDYVDRIHLLSKVYSIENQKELDNVAALNGAERIVLVPAELIRRRNGQPFNVGLIGLIRKGVEQVVLHTDVAYLCDDSGNTLERINVRKGR